MPRSPVGRGVLLLLVAAFLALRLAEAGGALPAWASSHGDDVLCLPLVLTLALAAHRFAGCPPAWTLPRSHGLAVLACYAALFELVLPRLSARFTADPLDLPAYTAGFILFQLVLNRPGSAGP